VAHSALANASIDVGLLEETAEHFQKSKEIRGRLPGFLSVADFSPFLLLGYICLLEQDFDGDGALCERSLRIE